MVPQNPSTRFFSLPRLKVTQTTAFTSPPQHHTKPSSCRILEKRNINLPSLHVALPRRSQQLTLSFTISHTASPSAFVSGPSLQAAFCAPVSLPLTKAFCITVARSLQQFCQQAFFSHSTASGHHPSVVTCIIHTESTYHRHSRPRP